MRFNNKVLEIETFCDEMQYKAYLFRWWMLSRLEDSPETEFDYQKEFVEYLKK